MGWQTILALVLVIPVLMIPVALVWYVNFGGLYSAMKETREKKTPTKQAEEQMISYTTKR